MLFAHGHPVSFVLDPAGFSFCVGMKMDVSTVSGSVAALRVAALGFAVCCEARVFAADGDDREFVVGAEL